MTGYHHKKYADSLSEFGQPMKLKHSGGWILKRNITDTPFKDAMGCYPLFVCRDWSLLPHDMQELEDDVVALSIVADPFGNYNPVFLKEFFTDVCIQFKTHYVADLQKPVEKFASKHHLRSAKKALTDLEIHCAEKPGQLLDRWIELYANLIHKHHIKGIARFSAKAFRQQLNIPGTVVFQADDSKETVGMAIFYVQNDVVYYHLGAYNRKGYEMRASFGIFWQAIHYFAETGLRWLNLGGGAGLNENADDGLSRFKRGWASETKAVYFCGRIFNKLKYSELVTRAGVPLSDYFPLYRQRGITR